MRVVIYGIGLVCVIATLLLAPAVNAAPQLLNDDINFGVNDNDDVTTMEPMVGDEESGATVASIESQPADCNAPPVAGYCKALLPRYYYDSSSKTCKQFNYGGCGGNSNNFLDAESCMAACGGSAGTNVTPKTDVPTPEKLTEKVEPTEKTLVLEVNVATTKDSKSSGAVAVSQIGSGAFLLTLAATLLMR